jgi:hypothetical protein
MHKHIVLSPLSGITLHENILSIGTPFNDIIPLISSQQNIILKYSEAVFPLPPLIHQEALLLPLIIQLPSTFLIFSPTTQRLESIHLTSCSESSFKYNDTLLPTPATLVSIYTLFGATFPGKYGNNTYTLSYPGITLIFQTPTDCSDELPLKLADGRSPVLQEIFIHNARSGDRKDGTSLPQVSLHSASSQDVKLMNGGAVEHVIVKRGGQGVKFEERIRGGVPVEIDVGEVRPWRINQ